MEQEEAAEVAPPVVLLAEVVPAVPAWEEVAVVDMVVDSALEVILLLAVAITITTRTATTTVGMRPSV